ncbi:MAG: sigma-70 family RNA polymerase sigma factor [bacterium]|nr:sigma-70 family RNA polymerase sigma factor [bacterium]
MHSLTLDAAGDDDRWEPDQASASNTAATTRQVVERHASALFRFARGLGADRELAADLTQEAFLIAWRKGKQDLPAAPLATFLRRTVRFLWLASRTRDRRAEAAISAAAERLWREDAARNDDSGLDASDELVAATRQCVEQLEGRAARAIHLMYGDGRKRVEIAEALDMTPNGVRTLLARTRRWLENCIRRRMP